MGDILNYPNLMLRDACAAGAVLGVCGVCVRVWCVCVCVVCVCVVVVL